MPSTAYASAAAWLTLAPNSDSSISRWSTSTATPVCSIRASVRSSGSSTPYSRLVPLRSSICVSSASARSITARARTIDASAATLAPESSSPKSSDSWSESVTSGAPSTFSSRFR